MDALVERSTAIGGGAAKLGRRTNWIANRKHKRETYHDSSIDSPNVSKPSILDRDILNGSAVSAPLGVRVGNDQRQDPRRHSA